MTVYQSPLVCRDGQQPLTTSNQQYQTEMYAIRPKPAFIDQLEKLSIKTSNKPSDDPSNTLIVTQPVAQSVNNSTNQAVKEMIPRPGLHDSDGRLKLGLAGHDYVFYQPKFYYRIFALVNSNDQSIINQSINQSTNQSVNQTIKHNDLVGSVLFTPDCEGPPNRVHGGATAAMFDQLLSVVGIANDVLGFTGSLSVRYERGVPFNVHLRFHCWVERIERRKVFIHMSLDDVDEEQQFNSQSNNQSNIQSANQRKPYATAHGIWISQMPEKGNKIESKL